MDNSPLNGQHRFKDAPPYKYPFNPALSDGASGWHLGKHAPVAFICGEAITSSHFVLEASKSYTLHHLTLSAQNTPLLGAPPSHYYRMQVEEPVWNWVVANVRT